MPQDQYIKLPDGTQGRFRADMPDSQIRQLIQRDFPDAYKPKQYLPEVNEALRTTPGRPSPPEGGFWSNVEQMPMPLPFSSFPSGQPILGKDNKMGMAKSTGDWTGKQGPRQVLEGIEQAAEPDRKEFYRGSVKAIGGAFETAQLPMLAGGIAAPLGAAKAIIGSTVTSYAMQQISRLAGGSPEAQQFWHEIGSVAGAGAGGAHEWLRGRYLQAVENAKSDMRAVREPGAAVDETELQKRAEQTVQTQIAKGELFPVSQTTGQVIIKAAQSGLFVDRDHELTKQFGKHAEATPSPEAPKRAPDIRDQIAALRADIEAAEAKTKTRPQTPVERIQEVAPKAEPPKVDPTKSAIDELSQSRRAANQLELLHLQKENESLRALAQKYPEPRQVETPAVPEGATRLESKQAEMKARQDVARADEADIRDLGNDRRAANQRKLTELRKENDALRAQTPGSSEVGRVPAPPEAFKPPVQPLQTTETPKGSGEPVRPTEGPSISEPRSLRGDLGERPPLAPQAFDVQARLTQHRERVTKWMDAHPGVSKSEAQRIVAEQMSKERGSFGGSEPEDVRARREAKINEWVGQIRDPKSPEAVYTQAYKMLKAFGLEDDEIIKRVSGAKDFAKTPEKSPIEERLGPNPELDKKADSIIGGLNEMVDRAMADYEKGTPLIDSIARAESFKNKGDPSISGVKDPSREELEKMFNLKDERGFWKLFPPKKAKPAGLGTGTALDDLTRNIESTLKAVPPDDSRMKISERLDKTLTEGWDNVQISLGKIAAHSAALKDMYMRPPEQTDYSSSIGRFSGALNRSAWELRQFTKEIKKNLPDERQREGITNWLQAGGDDALLAQRAARSTGSLRAGYERARTLTQDEIGYAKMIEAHFDRRLKEAINLGILDHGIENYVPQVWKPGDQTSMTNYFSSLTRSGLLKPDFNSAKHRIFDSYFEGEQLGKKPVNKDIGFLVASWERAFNQAVASRNLIGDLTKGFAKDGRPIIAPSGTGKTIWDSGSQSPLSEDKPSAYLIYPKAALDETGDYRAVNHPALTKWTWATRAEDGSPIFVKGDLRVHPDHAQVLDNVINRGKWAAAHPVQTAILKGQGFFKATLLSVSPYHQFQEGTHAIFHNVNPFHPPTLDLASPSLNKLLDRGLVIGNYDPIAAFDEGLTSGAGGALGKVPGLGRYMQKYSDYLFSDYIPRLKAKMATEAYDRNLKRFDNNIQNGSMTTDQIAEITANQANAAFGELNYIQMGRSPQTQAILRMMFLAPDFLEARTRFAVQALTPLGKEQRVALIRGALGMYGIARVLNQVLDDDPHYDKPFSLVVHGYEYKIRSLPGDIWNLMSDKNSFLQHRLSFLPRAGEELASGKDEFGRKRDLGQQAMDFARSIVPIPAQGAFKHSPEGLTGSLLSSVGITRSKYRTQAASLAHEYAIGSNPNDVTTHHISELVQQYQDKKVDNKQIQNWIQKGEMNPRDILTAMKLVQTPELYRDYRGLPVELKAKVWAKASPKERMIIQAYSKKELDMTRLLPEQRAEFMKSFANQ